MDTINSASLSPSTRPSNMISGITGMSTTADSPQDCVRGLFKQDPVSIHTKAPMDSKEGGWDSVQREVTVRAEEEGEFDDEEVELGLQGAEGDDDNGMDTGDSMFSHDLDVFDDAMSDIEDHIPGLGGRQGHRGDSDGNGSDEHQDGKHGIMLEDEDGEGVGAVKIRPEEMQYDEDEDYNQTGVGDDSELLESHTAGSSASDVSEVASHASPGTEDEDDLDGPLQQQICIFCGQDADNGSAEGFEACMDCSGCGAVTHQQCARDEYALEGDDGGSYWICPACKWPTNISSTTVEGVGGDDTRGQFNRTNDAQLGNPSSAHKINNLRRQPVGFPTHVKLGLGAIPYHTTMDDDDTMGGLRALRKRKTSPHELASTEHGTKSMALRKRRKNMAGDKAFMDVDSQLLPHGTLRLNSSRPLGRVEYSRDALFVTFHLDPSVLRGLAVRTNALGIMQKHSTERTVSPRPIRSGRERSGGNGIISATPAGSTARQTLATNLVAPFLPSAFSQPFYSFFDKETDEMKGKPYGGILTESEADTSRTLPLSNDRRRFDDAKQRAEQEWKSRVLAIQSSVDIPPRKAKKSVGPASQIECIEFGGWEIDTWYAAPYPEEYSRNRVLYICEFCLKYMNSDYVAWRHKLKCPVKHPPGDEIYRSGSVSVFEVDGRKNPVYCQNLCLLAKLFLGSKTLYYDVEPFLFYVLCEYDNLGYHFVGYFSKEKRASSQNNVSCILTLPIHQRKGYGNLLIDFSYLLTRVERKHGSPEKPLSDMGLVSYRNYWRLIMCQYLLAHVGSPNRKECGDGDGRDYQQYSLESRYNGLSIRQISDGTGLTPDDVVSALEGLRCLVRDPQSGLYGFRIDLAYCRDYISIWKAKNYVCLDPTALTWTPYVAGRTNVANFELGSNLATIAPRDDVPVGPNAPALGISVGTGVEKKPVKSDGMAIGDYALPTLLNVSPDTIASIESGGGRAQQATSDQKNPRYGVSARIETESMTYSSDHDRTQSNDISDTTTHTNQHTSWAAAYDDIPPSRFEAFPPVLNSRRTDRPRTAIPRRPVSTRDHMSRLTDTPARRSSGPKRATAISALMASKRKSGGTGRGPGRWPKGTKKSDYGNAESGPGLPPAWIKARQVAREKEDRESHDMRGARDKTNKLQLSDHANPNITRRGSITVLPNTNEHDAKASIDGRTDHAGVIGDASLTLS